MSQKYIFKSLFILIISLSPVLGLAQEWQAIVGEDALREIFSDKILTGTLNGKEKAEATYRADGTAELSAWGETFPRTWRIQGDDQACVTIEQVERCYTVERSLTDAGLYRVLTGPGTSQEFRVSGETVTLDPQPATDAGGATAPSAEELAAKLSNPTSPVMTIGNNFDYVSFKGDLPGAGDQSSFRYVFQTVFPFKLSNGGSVFFRPAIPLMFDEPVPNDMGGYSSVGTDIADIGFDLSYGVTTPSGLLWGVGVAGTLPTASNDALGKDLWGLGPELLIGRIGKWGVVGGILSHQWDIGGSGKGDIDQTALSYFYAFPLGGGWQIAAGPTVTYDHTRVSDDRWTVPLGIGIAKTSVIAGRPWKFQLQYWNYVEAPDAFSAQHQFRLSINPVVSAPWNDRK